MMSLEGGERLAALRHLRDARRYVRNIAKHCPELDEMMRSLDNPLRAADTVLARSGCVSVDAEREQAHCLLARLPAAAARWWSMAH